MIYLARVFGLVGHSTQALMLVPAICCFMRDVRSTVIPRLCVLVKGKLLWASPFRPISRQDAV